MTSFANAFVATRYLLRVRDAELETGLEEPPYASGRSLATALRSAEQPARARALARTLAALVHALEQRHLAR